MKHILSALFGLIWLSLISVGAYYLFLWLLPYCFYSAWWKVIIMAIFGTAIFLKLWNSVVPILAVYPIVFVANKLSSWKAAIISSAIPCMVIGITCILNFWLMTQGIPFDFKDWISAIVYNYVVASCYFHLTLAFMSMYNGEPKNFESAER